MYKYYWCTNSFCKKTGSFCNQLSLDFIIKQLRHFLTTCVAFCNKILFCWFLLLCSFYAQFPSILRPQKKGAFLSLSLDGNGAEFLLYIWIMLTRLSWKHFDTLNFRIICDLKRYHLLSGAVCLSVISNCCFFIYVFI